LAFPITDCAPLSADTLKRFHARRPARRNGGNGLTALPSTDATKLKTTRKTTGFSSDQTAPSTEAVYLTLSSLRTRFHRISR